MTATKNGTSFSFVHRTGVEMQNGVLLISDPLLQAVHNIIADPSVCHVTPVSRPRSRSQKMRGDQKADLEIRNDLTTPITELVVDVCFESRMREALILMDLDPSSALAMAIPSAASSLAWPDFITTINLAFEMAYARMASDPYFNWVSYIKSRALAKLPLI